MKGGEWEHIFAVQCPTQKTLILLKHVGDLDQPERDRLTGSREEWGEDAQVCPFGVKQHMLELTWRENMKCTRRNHGMC